jgi:hypothetical protein
LSDPHNEVKLSNLNLDSWRMACKDTEEVKPQLFFRKNHKHLEVDLKVSRSDWVRHMSTGLQGNTSTFFEGLVNPATGVSSGHHNGLRLIRSSELDKE